MEGDTRALWQLSDGWKSKGSATPSSVMQSDRNPHQKLIDDWRSVSTPGAHPAIAPFVKNYMLNSASDGGGDSVVAKMMGRCKDGLFLLIIDGCRLDEQLARAALLLMGDHSTSHAGRLRIPLVWGVDPVY